MLHQTRAPCLPLPSTGTTKREALVSFGDTDSWRAWEAIGIEGEGWDGTETSQRTARRSLPCLVEIDLQIMRRAARRDDVQLPVAIQIQSVIRHSSLITYSHHLQLHFPIRRAKSHPLAHPRIQQRLPNRRTPAHPIPIRVRLIHAD